MGPMVLGPNLASSITIFDLSLSSSPILVQIFDLSVESSVIPSSITKVQFRRKKQEKMKE